jgi:hypothetical protein
MASGPQPTGCFLIFTQAQLESMRDGQFSILENGKTMITYSDSGTTVTKQMGMDPRTMMVELRYALQIKDSQQYGSIDRVRVYNGLWNFRGL